MTGIEEAWIAYAAMAASAVSAGVSAYSAHESGIARSKAAAYQAAVAENNRKLAEQYAQAETEKGQRLEEQKRLQTASQQGAIRAAAGASGLDVNDGSPVRLASDTAALGELDALTIRNNAARSAFGYRVKGMDYAAQAELDNMSSEDAARSGELGMWGSIIGGASSVSDKWLGWKMKAGSTSRASGPMSGPDSGLG
jgi:hypothetical protein